MRISPSLYSLRISAGNEYDIEGTKYMIAERTVFRECSCTESMYPEYQKIYKKGIFNSQAVTSTRLETV